MSYFFFNDTATTEIYTLSLHDALPILQERMSIRDQQDMTPRTLINPKSISAAIEYFFGRGELSQVVDQTNPRSEEHTSELQSRQYLVCRLLLEKKQNKNILSSTH